MDWLATCLMLAVVFLGVATPTGPERRYPNFDSVAVGHCPLWGDPLLHPNNGLISKLIVNCSREVTGWANSNPLRCGKSVGGFLFRFCIATTMVGTIRTESGIDWLEIVCSWIIVTSSFLIWPALVGAPKVEIKSSSVPHVCNYRQSASSWLWKSVEGLHQWGCLLPHKCH